MADFLPLAIRNIYAKYSLYRGMFFSQILLHFRCKLHISFIIFDIAIPPLLLPLTAIVEVTIAKVLTPYKCQY